MDLAHWDSASEFTALQAAALIVGVDPAAPDAALHKATPVLERMREAHERLRAILVGVPVTAKVFQAMRKLPWFDQQLVSRLFGLYPVLRQEPWPSDPQRAFAVARQFAGPDGDFDAQGFDRAEIHRWLIAMGLQSVYAFVPQGDMQASATQAALVQDTVVHKIEQRSTILTREINMAIERSNSTEVDDVLSALRAIADDPSVETCLIGVTGEGVKYRNADGAHKDFKRRNLADRLRRLAEKRDKAR